MRRWPALLLALLLLAAPASAAPAPLRIEVGAGRIVRLAGTAASVFVADPKVAEVRPASPDALFVFGVGPGRTTVAALDAKGHVLAEQLVSVAPSGYAAAQAQAAIARLLPGSAIRVAQSGSKLLLTGPVATPAQAARAVALARGFAADDKAVVDELTVKAHTQVTLAVRIVEMDRSVTRSLGVNWSALGTLGRIGKLPAVNGVLNSTGTLNGSLGAACASGPIGSVACLGLSASAMIDALATDGLVHVLAEPNLTVMSGQPASFLVGGEFPIPVGQENGQITIAFKRYGVQLAFVPTVLDDGRIDLKVSPEVSQLSQQGAVQLTAGNSTISVPALTVRRAETTVELGSGQSFAIAGLLQDTTTRDRSGLPALRQLPVLGKLFGSEDFQRNRTELVILVTPLIVRPVDRATALKTPDDDRAAQPTPPNFGVIPVPARMRGPGVPQGAGFAVE